MDELYIVIIMIIVAVLLSLLFVRKEERMGKKRSCLFTLFNLYKVFIKPILVLFTIVLSLEYGIGSKAYRVN